MALIDASPKTADCRLGVLCGCGARYCGIKCLVADAQEHKAVCESNQLALQLLAKSRFRANEETNQAALNAGGRVQINLLIADMLLATNYIVDALVNAANIAREAEAFELAQKLAQRALSLAPKGSLNEADALNMLGIVSKDLSNYDAAVAYYEAALKIRKNLLADNHAEVADLHGNLSAMFRRLGRRDEALAMCSSALEIFKKASGDHQKDIVGCHQNMGNNLKDQGKYEEAMEHFSTGLAIVMKTEGDSAGAADFLVNIGAVFVDQNKLEEAMQKFVSALKIYEKAKLDVRVAGCHHNIGELLMRHGKFDAALEHARKALAIKRSKGLHELAECGENHMLIGEIFLKTEKFAEALDEFENALRIRKSVFGEMSLQVGDVYAFKASCFFNLRKWREAVTFYEAAIHIRTVLLGADDASLVDLKADLAVAEVQLTIKRRCEKK